MFFEREEGETVIKNVSSSTIDEIELVTITKNFAQQLPIMMRLFVRIL